MGGTDRSAVVEKDEVLSDVDACISISSYPSDHLVTRFLQMRLIADAISSRRVWKISRA
jgi:hypothetical protein